MKISRISFWSLLGAIVLLSSSMMVSRSYAASSPTQSVALPSYECNVTQGATITACPSTGSTATEALGAPLPPNSQLQSNSQQSQSNASNLISIPGSSNPPVYYSAVRSDRGSAVVPIDAFGYCRYVDNNSSSTTPTSIFVPFKSAAEWGSPNSNLGFIGAALNGSLSSYITLVPCARPTPPGGGIPIPNNGPLYPASLPPCTPAATQYGMVGQYGRPNVTLASAQAIFTCGSGGPTQWTLKATASLIAGADNDTPNQLPTGGWTITNITYSSIGNGTCGSANGVAISTAPTANLCTAGGTASSVTGGGSGPWTWTCTGSSGSPTSCSAPDSTACGSADGVAVSSAPSTNLCSAGATASAVTTSSGSWTWTCSGGSGSPASCSAPEIACGSADGVAVSSAPSTNLCSTDATASSVTGGGSGPWTWTCSGGSGPPMSCSAPVNGLCGSNAGTCNSGTPTAPTTVNGVTDWNCNGSGGGGSNASCVASSSSGSGSSGGTCIDGSSAYEVGPNIDNYDPNTGCWLSYCLTSQMLTCSGGLWAVVPNSVVPDGQCYLTGLPCH